MDQEGNGGVKVDGRWRWTKFWVVRDCRDTQLCGGSK